MDVYEKLREIKQDRFDLSDFLIHFTRRGDKLSFETLIDIVESGVINCSWSVRGAKRTIFGSLPAICFTDMPLYSFYKYVVNRNDLSKVDFYGVALSKTTMFRLGARNVIYGTTSAAEPDFRREGEEMFNENLPESEQYRYMLTNINDINDWTHEREWRWSNRLGLSNGNCLPIWINKDYEKDFGGDPNFSFDRPIFLIVRFDSEVQVLVERFAKFLEPEKYNQFNIGRTYAISLQTLRSNGRLNFTGLDYISLFKDGIPVKIF